MNVAVLVKEFPPDIIGGTETQTLRMARALEEHADHDVTVYTKAYGSDSADGAAGDHADEPFDLVRVPNWDVTPFVSTLTFVIVATLYLLRDARRFDVLQCMMIYPNGFVGYVVSTLTGLPYFAWIRGGDYYFMKKNRVKRWMIARVLGDTRVLVQTEKVRRDVHAEFPDADLTVVGNGVDLPVEMADGDDVVYVGRLKKQKGVDVLPDPVEAAGQVVVVVSGQDRSSPVARVVARSRHRVRRRGRAGGRDAVASDGEAVRAAVGTGRRITECRAGGDGGRASGRGDGHGRYRRRHRRRKERVRRGARRRGRARSEDPSHLRGR